jgi:hypothetical protein
LAKSEQGHIIFVQPIGFAGFLYKYFDFVPGHYGFFLVVPFTFFGFKVNGIPSISIRLHRVGGSNGYDTKLFGKFGSKGKQIFLIASIAVEHEKHWRLALGFI